VRGADPAQKYRVTGRRVVIVGAGVAGLAAAWTLRRITADLDVVLLDAARRAGGLVETEHTPDGFLLEHGADCLLTAKPAGVRVARGIGLGNALVSGPEARRTYLAAGDRLVPLPPVLAGPRAATAWAVLRTPVLSVRGKTRVALEPVLRRTIPDGDESVAAFLGARFGPEIVDAVIAPLLGGIHGGDPARLSADACLPGLRAFERLDGSVTLGMWRALRARDRRVAVGEETLAPVVTLRDGMGSLTDALARAVGDRLRSGVAVRRIERRRGGGFRVDTSSGALACEGVIVALPAWAAAPVVAPLDGDLAAGLAAVPYKALHCVSLAWRRADVAHSLDGTGFVRGAGSRRPTTACTWASEKWPGRAPAGTVLVRSSLEGDQASDADLIAAARDDLGDLLGTTARPLLARVRRLPRATPVYTVGHAERMARIRRRTTALGVFALTGSAYGGVGVPDCIANGERAAAETLAALDNAPGDRRNG
jgi:oxygen-dependent protoporphyrinogen oxidase